MDHQDWNQYIVHCKNAERDESGNIKKTKHKDNTKENILEKKVGDGHLKHKKITKEISQEIQKARLSKGLTQKDLANQLSIPQNIINDIECGKALYNGQQISKIRRKLGIKTK
jgi:ribosome-binding protein aMBF1 (putative translation factor)